MIYKPEEVEIWERLKQNLYFDSDTPNIIFVNSMEEISKEQEKYFQEAIAKAPTIKIKKGLFAPTQEIKLELYTMPVTEGGAVSLASPNMENEELLKLHFLYNLVK